MIKLLHTADWQIGKLFGQFSVDDAALLAEARFLAVERLAAMACEHRVDLVVVAGDVFDAQGVADKTIHRLFHALAGFAGPWFMIPGNHDAGLAESVWTRAQRLDAIPDNVTICLRPEAIVRDELNVVLLPAPLTQRITHLDATEWYASAATPNGMARIGLAHGSVQGVLADGIDSSNPIAAGRAEQARLDYLALGDWHGARRIDARTWYSGTPEPDRFKANDSGQALLVELAESGALPQVTPLETRQYRWTVEPVEIRVPSDVDRAIERIGTYGANDVLQLELSGLTDLASHRRLIASIERARGRTRGLQLDLSALRIEPTAEDVADLRADGYLGEVLAELRQAQNGPDAEVARDALILLAGILDEQRAKTHVDRGT